MKDNFEQHLKTSLDSFEAKYNPAHWADMESRLNKSGAGKSVSTGKILGIAAGIISVAGLVYYFSTNDSGNKQTDNTITTAQNIPLNNNVEKDPSTTLKVTNNNEPEVIANNNSKEEKAISENKISKEKISSQEKTETITENKSDKQEQPQTSTIEPNASNAGLNASFHSQNSVCLGTAAEFTADGVKTTCTYRWEFGDGKTSGEQSPKHTYAKAGTYTVKLRLTSTKDKTSDEQKNILVVNSVPNIDMNYNVSDENPSLVNFEAKDGNVKEWNWDFGDKQSSGKQNPSHEYKKGNYDVIVTATNTSGCSSSARKLVAIENEFPLAPTAFSPNNDGINETWMPGSFTNGDYNFSLTVFDRTGKEVFKTSDKNNAWRGDNAKTGDRFTWKAAVKDKNGKEANYQGVITIIE